MISMVSLILVIISMMLLSINVNSFAGIKKVNRQLILKMSSFPIDDVKLGDSDLKISKITLGTMTFGQQNTEQDAHDQLNLAFDKYGINIFDTAEMYPVPTKPDTQGNTDRYISTWLKKRDRSKVVIATKVSGPGITWLPGRNGQSSRVSRNEILTSVDESLKRLGTDYIDLIQIHWPDRYIPLFGAGSYNISLERDYVSFQEQLEAFSELVKAGKVRYIGVSNETPYGVMKFAELARHNNLPKIVSIQNSYSLLVRADYESSLVEVCSPRHENIGLLAYSPLCGGILTGKYQREDCPKNSRFNIFPSYMERYKQSSTLQAVEKYSEIAKKYSLTPTQLALAWCYKRQHVTSTIIGATTIPQLIENIEAYNKISIITDEVEADIRSVYSTYRDPTKDMSR